MAEAVGVVASAVGIAAFGQQLASSIQTIKEFCEAVKDAPDELRDVLDQIENISKIMARLGHLEETSPSTEVDDVLQASAQLCRTAIGRISTLAQELEDEVKRNRVRGSVRAVLKRKGLEKLLVKLERNKADLLIAHSMYADVRKSKELERLHRFVEEMRDGQLQMIEYTKTVSSPSSNIEEKHNASRPYRRIGSRERSHRALEVQVRFPLWLCQYAWDVAFERASGCWNMSLKSFRIVTDGAVWDSVVEGNLMYIRKLLEARQLSIHDRDEHGRTLTSVRT
jgi:GTP1/Obg family GTP-binding protein